MTPVAQQRKFGGDRAVVEKIISLGNLSYTVAGVIGKDFLAEVQADLWPDVRVEFVRAVAGRSPQWGTTREAGDLEAYPHP
jgi:hypothetical protein